MELLVEQLLRSPKLEIYLEQLSSVRSREKSARHAFLEKINEDDKAEFINGEAIFHSPVKFSHAKCSFNLAKLVSAFASAKALGVVGHEKLMVSLTRNDYEPDIAFWKSDVAAAFKPDQMRFPAPNWIVEVLSPSTEANDRGVKLEDYAAHGIPEYWIIDPEQQTIEQYQLDASGHYQLALKSNSGNVRSTAIEGFTIPILSVFDDAENLRTLTALLGQ